MIKYIAFVKDYDAAQSVSHILGEEYAVISVDVCEKMIEFYELPTPVPWKK